MLHDILQEISQYRPSLDLSDNELQFYVTLLQLGANNATQIAHQIGMDRSSAYRAAETLTSKGLITYEPKGDITIYTAQPPKKLVERIRNKQKQLKKEENDLNHFVQKLEKQITSPTLQSNITVLEGPNVIRDIWEDMLSENVTTQRQLIRIDVQKFFIDKINEQSYEEWVQDYIKRRVAKGIELKYLCNKEWHGLEYTTSNSDTLKEVRALPDEFLFSTNMCVYADKVATHTLDPENIKGVIIKDPSISQTHTALFDYLWKNSGT